MPESGDGGEKSGIEGPGARAAFVPLMRKVTGPVFGGVTVLAAVVGLVQPFARSDAAATKDAFLGLAAFLLVAGVCVLIYIYGGKRVEVPLWLGIPGLVLVLGAALAFALWPSGPRNTGSQGAASSLSSASALPSIAASSSATPGPTLTSTPTLDVTPDGPVPALVAQAIVSLDSDQTATRLQGVAALQQVMQAVPADQPAAITALCDFLRKDSPVSDADGDVAEDVQAALTALAGRNPANDGGAVVELGDTNFTSARLSGAHFAGASISGENGADFSDADLAGADFSGADLANSYFGDADITGADFTNATLTGASFFDTPLCSGSTPLHPEQGYNCTE